jgi:hypothetical protein
MAHTIAVWLYEWLQFILSVVIVDILTSLWEFHQFGLQLLDTVRKHNNLQKLCPEAHAF